MRGDVNSGVMRGGDVYYQFIEEVYEKDMSVNQCYRSRVDVKALNKCSKGGNMLFKGWYGKVLVVAFLALTLATAVGSGLYAQTLVCGFAGMFPNIDPNTTTSTMVGRIEIGRAHV